VQQFGAISKGLNTDDLLHFWFSVNFWTPPYFSREGYVDFPMSVKCVVWSIFLIWNMVCLWAFSCSCFSTGSFYNCASSVTLWRTEEPRASDVMEFVDLLSVVRFIDNFPWVLSSHWHKKLMLKWFWILIYLRQKLPKKWDLTQLHFKPSGQLECNLSRYSMLGFCVETVWLHQKGPYNLV